MRLANFFDRTAAALAQVITGSDPESLRTMLSKKAVILAFDASAAMSSEGSVALELLTDLLARLYPGVCPRPLDSHPATLAVAAKLGATAKAIHPDIDLRFRPERACLCLAVGMTDPEVDLPTVFLGSHGWTAFVGGQAPIGSAETDNPFGGAAAACIAAAHAFRTIFADSLAGAPPVGLTTFDVLHQEARACPVDPAIPAGIDLGGTHLVGLGAIGRATAWTLARVPLLTGSLAGVDHERIERTNLQRYVGATQADRAKSREKTRSVAGMFAATGVTFEGYRDTWGGYLAKRKDTRLPLVATALDSAEDRIAVQAALPQATLNAWTQPGDLGVSRHGFLSGPCLACLYMPDGKVPSLSDRIAKALRLPELEIRRLLHAGARVDDALVAQIAEATGVSAATLRPFAGSSLSQFYAKAVCGTAHFGARGRDAGGATAVPMAFQSALAGVLLAAEVLVAKSAIRDAAMRPLTKIDLMKGIGSILTEPATKHRFGRCICQDPDFISAYRAKYSTGEWEQGGR